MVDLENSSNIKCVCVQHVQYINSSISLCTMEYSAIYQYMYILCGEKYINVRQKWANSFVKTTTVTTLNKSRWAK